MIVALAKFEGLSDLCTATVLDTDVALFGSQPSAEALIACADAEPAGFALFFHGYSTFRGRRSLWLEDLFVEPAWRRRGCARALLGTLAAIAAERQCCRLDWAVLDWNAAAIDFYQRLGATILPDWRIARIDGPALRELGGSAPDR
jgi:GNAT superfamily N-acetyltransferase